MVLTQIYRFNYVSSSQESLRSAHISSYLCSGLFVNFIGDFWGYLEIKSFSQRISENYGKRKFRRFGVVLKL